MFDVLVQGCLLVIKAATADASALIKEVIPVLLSILFSLSLLRSGCMRLKRFPTSHNRRATKYPNFQHVGNDWGYQGSFFTLLARRTNLATMPSQAM